MSVSVLIVEDDLRLRKLFTKILEDEHYHVRTASTAQDALGILQEFHADLVLSDVVLRGSDGTALCHELRSRPETAHLPIVLMSGRRIKEDDLVQGLGAGADDYLLKPVSGPVLVAKIQSVLRRYRAPHDLAETLKSHGLALDVQARTVSLRGHKVNLTRKEFDLLTAFLRQPGQLLTNDYLLQWVWGVDPKLELDTRTLTVHVSSLRNKLGDTFRGRIANVPRLGYRFDN